MSSKVAIAFQYLVDLSKSWGGSIEVITDSEFTDIEEKVYTDKNDKWTFSSSDGYALHWGTKRIVTYREAADPGTIIHEMGHAFLDLEDPGVSDEWSWLGWEICLAKKAECYRVWSKQNGDYSINMRRMGDWRNLSSRQRSDIAIDRIRHGKSIGIIDKSGNPLRLR
jgi:hypothetical protein